MRTPLALALLRLFLKRGDQEEILGDLEEGYRRRLDDLGPKVACRWLWRQSLSVPLGLAAERFAFVRLIGKRNDRSQQTGSGKSTKPRSLILFFEDQARNFKLALRSVRRRPLFVLIPVLSLCIGIGVNTVVFSTLNVFLLQETGGIRNANRMVEVGTGRNGVGFSEFNYPDFLDLREQSTVLAEVSGYKYQMLTLSRGEAGERVFGLLVSANYFDLLGVSASFGRTFLPEEDSGANDHPVIVLSHAFWQSRWGGDTDVVGSTVYLSRQPYTVVGIAPIGFRGHTMLGSPDVYVPLMQHPSLNQDRNYFESRGSTWLNVLALLDRGHTVAEADAELAMLFQRLSDAYPETNDERTASVRSFGALPSTIRGYVGLFMAVLMGFALLLLLITCANVAGMFLARASARRKEIAIQLALGSSRRQLTQQLLIESLFVFCLGSIGGVTLAVWCLQFISSLTLPGPFPISFDIALDGVALLFAIGLTLCTGLIFGLLPARRALRLDLTSTLKNEGARPQSSEGRLRRWFVSAQVAASLVLLVGAGLLIRALQEAANFEKGFDTENTYVTFLDLTTEGYTAETGAVFQKEILEYFEAQSWLESVALSIDLPLDMSTHGTTVVPEGWDGSPGRERLHTRYNSISNEYFETLRIDLVEGRLFDVNDRLGSNEVAIVSQTFALRAWPNESAVGRRLDGYPSSMTVVGVVEDVPNALLTETPQPLLYRPLAQAYGDEANLVIRSSADPSLVTREIYSGLRTLDPRISLSPVVELERFTGIGILPQRIAGGLATILGSLALLLSAMGVYGIMAFAVTQRRREMGIRLALGAESGQVLRSVILGAFRVALPGIVLGIVLALALGVVLRSLLLGVSPRDPLALLSAGSVVGLMVLAGTLIPACRAAGLDPSESLRYE